LFFKEKNIKVQTKIKYFMPKRGEREERERREKRERE